VSVLTGCFELEDDPGAVAGDRADGLASEVGDDEGAVMPDVVCHNLQDAQDEIQEGGVFLSRSVDATGRDRKQLWDRNWVVVDQSPAPGTRIGEGDAVLSVVKEGEASICDADVAAVAAVALSDDQAVASTVASTVPATLASTSTVAPPATPTEPVVVTAAPVPTTLETVVVTTVELPPPETVAFVPPISQNCDPNYEGACVPIASDVDCAGGRGNGPAYVDGPVYVVGTDIYELDGNNNDGVGCE
jgi:hypothetical protein